MQTAESLVMKFKVNGIRLDCSTAYDNTHMQSENIVAGTLKVFGQLLQVIAPHLTPELLKTNTPT